MLIVPIFHFKISGKNKDDFLFIKILNRCCQFSGPTIHPLILTIDPGFY